MQLVEWAACSFCLHNQFQQQDALKPCTALCLCDGRAWCLTEHMTLFDTMSDGCRILGAGGFSVNTP